jgi:hypothetical protein
MAGEIEAFLTAIPSAAQSPYGIIAFLATIAAWSLISLRVTRHKQLMRRINQFPPEDRRKIVQAEMNASIPPELAPQEWITTQLHRYYFLGAITLIACISAIFVVAYSLRSQVSRIDASMSLYADPRQREEPQPNPRTNP